MTPKDIDLVQSSFAKVAPIDDETGVRFYERLFEIAPDLKRLFHGDMEEQGRMFMSMLTVAVNGLADFDSIKPALRELAIRHAGYGVGPKDYAAVGAALIGIMDESLGDGFTAEVRNAWLAVYDALSGVMIEAARRIGSAD
jgi:hemoglobin-like flavoprotein